MVSNQLFSFKNCLKSMSMYNSNVPSIFSSAPLYQIGRYAEYLILRNQILVIP